MLLPKQTCGVASSSERIEYRRNGRYFLYVITCENSNYIKIGVTAKLKERLHSLQTGCPYKLNIACVVCFKGEQVAYYIENKIHDLLKEWSIRGEWFNDNCISHLERFLVKIKCRRAYKYSVIVYHTNVTLVKN